MQSSCSQSYSKNDEKEKDEDAGFKIANQMNPLRLLATSDKEGGKVTFRLRQKFGIDEPKTAEEIQI